MFSALTIQIGIERLSLAKQFRLLWSFNPEFIGVDAVLMIC